MIGAGGRPARRHHRVLVPEQQRVDAAEIGQLGHPRAQRRQLGWRGAHELGERVDVVEQLVRVGERVVLGQVGRGLLARAAAERHVERDQARRLVVVDALVLRGLDVEQRPGVRPPARARAPARGSSSGTASPGTPATSPTSRSSERSSADRRPASSRRRPMSAPSSSSSAPRRSSSSRAAVETRCTCSRASSPASERSWSAVVSAASMIRWTCADACAATGGGGGAGPRPRRRARAGARRPRPARSRGGRSGSPSAGSRSGRGPRRDATR